jgi:ribose 1,5-bisphosphate isomerase
MVTSSSPAGGSALLAVKRDIETMKTRGAGEIGRQAALALAKAADAYKGDTVRGLQDFLVEAARLLSSARPTAVTLRNGLNAILSSASGAKGLEDARSRVRRAADEYANRVAAAKQEIAKLALPLFQKNDVVLTHCHSTAAGGAIAHAAKKLPGIRVFSTETRPFRQGLIQAPSLAKEGVDVTLIVDSAVSFVMETERVTKVVVGADTIDAEGGLYNKIGTRQVAILARHYDVPFYVCAEREKFSPYTAEGETVQIEERPVTEIADPAEVPGVRIRNPVFDRTPPELVTAYVTDRGVLKPADVGAFIRREFAGLKKWI